MWLIYIYIPLHLSEWRVGTRIPTRHVVWFVAFELSGVVEGTRETVIGDHADDVVSGFATTRRFTKAPTCNHRRFLLRATAVRHGTKTLALELSCY